MTNSIQELIQAIDQASSAQSLTQAVRELAAVNHKEAIPTLTKVLGYNNPGASVAAVEGLIALGEDAVIYLLKHLDGYNYGARAWAIRVFAGVGDPRALDLLLNAASSDFALSVRRAAAKGLGFIHWSRLHSEEIEEAQERTLHTLLQVCADPEWVVRYGAIVGLQGLSSNFVGVKPLWKEQITTKFKQIMVVDEEIVVKARAKMALEYRQ